MIELVLVEGVSDVQLISYYLQSVYQWSYEKNNTLGIVQLDDKEHIENLSKEGNQLVLCGVGGNGKFGHFIELHRVNSMIVEKEITSVMLVTDRDEDTNGKIGRTLGTLFDDIKVRIGTWMNNTIQDSFGQIKNVNTYLLVIPTDKKGALERVIIDALYDLPEQNQLIGEIEGFISSLKEQLAPQLKKENNANKATVGTFFSIKNPKNAMRAFANYISLVDWARSESLKELFLPFMYLGEEKP